LAAQAGSVIFAAMSGIEDTVVDLCRAARAAGRRLATASTNDKNEALTKAASLLRDRASDILGANRRDVAAGREAGMSAALLDRLTLDEDRLDGVAEGLLQVAALEDPVGETIQSWRRPNGLEINQVRIPIGVIGIIYESRPNVTADAAALCLKSGNAAVLKGGKEAILTNSAIAAVLADAVAAAGLPADSVRLIESTERAATKALLKQSQYIDVIVPRGGPSLIEAITSESSIPVIQHYAGVCHVFVDRDADLEMARRIAVNSKVQRPGVCNAMETLLVHSEVAESFLPTAAAELQRCGVELRGCPRTQALVAAAKTATEEDWSTEYLDLILSVRVVDSLDDAVEHIGRYGTGHSDAIVTDSYSAAAAFTAAVDSAAVYVNASTRFTDGFMFGFGAEVGISTNRLHARGPMGLRNLTTYKYVVRGSGQIRE
jgi:glutamate-5-semialdehyde dehydrogenase